MPGPRPLPPRAGIDAVRVRLPDPPGRRSVREELRAAHPDHVAEIEAQLDAGEVVDRYGNPVGEYARPVKGVDVWLYLSPPDEPDVPGTLEVVFHDDAMAVVDKPHFLATTPRAAHIRETALVRARVATGEPHLVPSHRLDRGTAGLVVMAVDPALRGALATQFEARSVVKKYLAVTALQEQAPRAWRRASRIEKIRGILQGREIPGPANALTSARLLARAVDDEGEKGLWLLSPHTGQTHQLRIHLSALGMPILDDDLYPRQRAWDAEDFSRPLQLLAAGIECAHPSTGERLRFTSPRRLDRWPGEWPVADVWDGP